MASIPPHKRYSKDAEKPTQVPDSLITDFKKSLNHGSGPNPGGQGRQERANSSDLVPARSSTPPTSSLGAGLRAEASRSQPLSPRNPSHARSSRGGAARSVRTAARSACASR